MKSDFGPHYLSKHSLLVCIILLMCIGLEYRAVFLCTSEPVNKDCTPFEPVKSLCDPRVFNTIITRSQSLVIAVGNPFRLMKIEEKIPDSEGDKHCWLSYFQRCWESNTLILSYELNREYNSQHCHNACLSELKNYLLQRKINQINDIPRLLYSTNIDSNSTIKREYLELCNTGRSPEGFQGWEYGQDSRTRIACQKPGGVNVIKVTTCHLQAVSPDCCIAYPLNGSHPPLTIHGADNRRCAFNGATIEVANRKGGQSITVAVTNQGEVNPLLCTVDPDNPAMLVPVDKVTIPMFHLKDRAKDAHINCEALREVGRHYFISCFNLQSLRDSPRVTHSIPLDVAVNLLFVVLPFVWHVKDRFPYGAALAAIPKGTSLPLAKFILQDYCSKNPEEHVNLKLKDAVVEELNMRRDTEAIAIVQPDGLSLCAFSVAHCPGYFSIKVHITNVADSITFPEASESTSCTIDKEVMPKLSFTGQQSQNVITVEYEIKESDFSFHDRRRLYQPNIKIRHRGFSTSSATCKQLLSLSDLEDILVSLPHLEDFSKVRPAVRHIPSQKTGNLNMLDRIAILCIAAKVLHRKRVGHDGYNLLEMSSVKYPEAQQLVNEFLIQANYEAASRIKERFPGKMLLKRSIPLPGSEDQIGSIVASSQVIPSYPLLRLTKPSDVKSDCLLDICDLPILPSILQELIAVLKIPDKIGLKQVLCLLHHHPQCAVLLSRLRQFLMAEEFHVFNKAEANSTEYEMQHFIHRLPLYTSFTSPFQCIGDLFVQEGLLAAIRGTEWKRTTEELKLIANQCSNPEELNLIESKKMFKLASAAQQSSVYVEAFVQQSKQGTLEWCFLPPNEPHTTVFWVVTATLLEKLVRCPYRVRIVSADGTSVLSSWVQVVSDYSSGEQSKFAFVSGTGGSKALSRVYLRENSEPSLFRLSQQMVIDLTECIDDLTRGADMARKLEALYKHQVKTHERNPLLTNTAFAAIQVPFPVQPYQVSRLWLGCDPTSYVLSVQPQCIELAPDVRVCLQHMQHPLTCFTQCPTEVASKLTYSSVSQYVKLWKDAMFGASAMLGVSNTTSSLVYKNVLLKFPKFVIPPHILTQDMYTPVGDITASFRRECLTSSSDLFTIQKGDLLCARYEVDLSGTQLSDVLEKYQPEDYIHLSNSTVARAVLHMVVKEVYVKEPIEVNVHDIVCNERSLSLYVCVSMYMHIVKQTHTYTHVRTYMHIS